MSSMEQIINWKGQATNSIVPSNSRPLLGTEQYNTGPPFKPRPIKHWRKQLNPRDDAGRGREGVGMPMDYPGGSVYLGTEGCVSCTPSAPGNSYSIGLKNDIIKNPQIIPPTPRDIYFDPITRAVNCVACNPENNVIKPATTVLSKKYYTDSRAYMKARCRLYDQRASTNLKAGVTYTINGVPVPPSNSPNGSQVRLMKDCDDKCPTYNSQQVTIYKPNNTQFAVQGGVASSTRIDRLKLNTINKNAASFRAAWGQEGANAARYQGTEEAPYFLKSRYQKPSCFHKNGNKNLCTYIMPVPPSSPPVNNCQSCSINYNLTIVNFNDDVTINQGISYLNLDIDNNISGIVLTYNDINQNNQTSCLNNLLEYNTTITFSQGENYVTFNVNKNTWTQIETNYIYSSIVSLISSNGTLTNGQPVTVTITFC